MNVNCSIPKCKNLACQFFIYFKSDGEVDIHGTSCQDHKWMVAPYSHFTYVSKSEYIEKVLKFKILT